MLQSPVLPSHAARTTDRSACSASTSLARPPRFGYWFVAEWRGRGLASAAAALVADWRFTNRGLVAIEIDREPSNRASARVVEKLGAVVTGSHWAHYAGAEVELVRHTLNSPAAPTTGHQ